MAEEEPGQRIIRVTITPKGRGKIQVLNEDPYKHQPSFPDEMNGAEAHHRAIKLQGMTQGYNLQVDDQTLQN